MSLSDDDGRWHYEWESEMRTRRELIRGNPIGALVDEIEGLQGLPVEEAFLKIQALPAAIPSLIQTNNSDGVWKVDSLTELFTSKVNEVLGLPRNVMMDGLERLRATLIRDGGPATREAAARLCLVKLTTVMPALQSFCPSR